MILPCGVIPNSSPKLGEVAVSRRSVFVCVSTHALPLRVLPLT